MAALSQRRSATEILLCCLACAGTGARAPVARPAVAPTAGTAILVGTGDIARCDTDGPQLTARLVDNVVGRAERDGDPVAVFTAGDNAYPDGTLAQLQHCFGESWGRPHLLRLMRPAAGNHDYHVEGAADYFAYFGPAAGPAGKGYYTYRLGSWRIIVLNSEIEVRSRFSDADRATQEQWLRGVLSADSGRCTLAYWHSPRFSSGWHGSDPRVGALWSILYAAGAEVVISSDDHDYERFAPQAPNGTRDASRGLREFVVGTGGGTLREFAVPVTGPAFLSSSNHLAPTVNDRSRGSTAYSS